MLAENLDEIERAAAGQGTAPRGELRLTAPILFGRLHVLPIVTEFLDRFPEVQAALALVDRPVDLVEEGLDVAVRIGALGESSAVATRVGALRRIVVASPDYLARRGTPQRPADLTDHAVVAFSGIAGVEHWVFRDATRDVNVAIRPRLVVSTAEAAIDAARAGFGLTRVLSYQAADDVARGSLLRVLPAYEGDEVPIHLVYPGGRHPPPKLRAFLDFTTPRLRRRCAAMERADLFLTLRRADGSITESRSHSIGMIATASREDAQSIDFTARDARVSRANRDAKRLAGAPDHRSSQTGVRFSTNAEMPSSASCVIMFLSMISLA